MGEYVAKYGITSGIILILIYVIYFLVKQKLKKLIKSFVSFINKSETPDIDYGSLKFHPFFYNIQYRLTVEIPNLDICPETPVKQMVFRDLIYFRTRSIYDGCIKLTDLNMAHWSKSQWASEITKLMNEMTISFIELCKSNSIPDAVVSKFTKWHSPTTEMMNEYIQSLGGSDIYSDHTVRTATFLMIMNLLLITTIADAERSLKDLNGDIAGKMYKNMIIEH